MTKPKAISIIEFLTVIAIIGIVSVALTPTFSRFLPSIRLSGATKELVVQLKKAQQYAVSEQIIYQIKIIKAENKYQLIQKGDSQKIISETQLPPTISFGNISFSPTEIDFNAIGAPSKSGTIELVNQRNKKTIIEINPAGFITSSNKIQ